MNERLEKLIKAEGLTSAKFAEILSVQPSSISHLLSGRNNPNFEFISRLLQMFPDVNPRWFINGEGDMYIAKEIAQNTVVDNCEDYKSDLAASNENTETNTLDNVSNIENDTELELFTNVTTTVNNSSENTNVTAEEITVEPAPAVVAPVVPEPASVPAPTPETEPKEEIISTPQPTTSKIEPKAKQIVKVMFFYDDNTFEVFNQ